MSKNAVTLLFNSQTVNETHFKLKRLAQFNINASVIIFAIKSEFSSDYAAESTLNRIINNFSKKLYIRVIWIDQILRDHTIYPAYKDTRVNDGRSYTEIIKVLIPTLDEVINYNNIIYIGHFIDIDESFEKLFNYKFSDNSLLAMPRYVKTLEQEAITLVKHDLRNTELKNKNIIEFKNPELIIYNYELFKSLYQTNNDTMKIALEQVLQFQRINSTLLYEQTLLNLFYPSDTIVYKKYYGNTKKQINNYFSIINSHLTINNKNTVNTENKLDVNKVETEITNDSATTEATQNDEQATDVSVNNITYITDTSSNITCVEYEMIIENNKATVINEITTVVSDNSISSNVSAILTPDTVEKTDKQWKKQVTKKYNYDSALDKVNLDKLKMPQSKKQRNRKKITEAS